MNDHKRRDNMENQERKDGHAETVAAVMRRINAEGWRLRRHHRDRWIAFAEAAWAGKGDSVEITFALPPDRVLADREALRQRVREALLPDGADLRSPGHDEARALVDTVTDGLNRASEKARLRERSGLRERRKLVTLAVVVSGEFVARHLGGGEP